MSLLWVLHFFANPGGSHFRDSSSSLTLSIDDQNSLIYGKAFTNPGYTCSVPNTMKFRSSTTCRFLICLSYDFCSSYKSWGFPFPGFSNAALQPCKYTIKPCLYTEIYSPTLAIDVTHRDVCAIRWLRSARPGMGKRVVGNFCLRVLGGAAAEQARGWE